MTAGTLVLWPDGAAPKQRTGRTMDVILHLGSHRTGSTTFQSYMRRNNKTLNENGIGYWGPQRTRQGLFAGLMPSPRLNFGPDASRRAERRVQLQLARSAQMGLRKLVVSDENMIGSVRHNLRSRGLYPAIGERMARYARAFDGQIARVVLNIRGQDSYWASGVSYGVARGHQMLSEGDFQKVSASRRTWRDVITDLSCALPKTEIKVLPFERFQGRPEAMLESCIEEPTPANSHSEWLNRAPDVQALRRILAERGDISGLRLLGTGRWLPFTDEQRAALREAYADDMHWLIAGADGLATLTEDTDQKKTEYIPHFAPLTKGQGHDQHQRHMAQHR